MKHGGVADPQDVDAEFVSRLVAGQFPRWAGEAVRPVGKPGVDNSTFRQEPQCASRSDGAFSKCDNPFHDRLTRCAATSALRGFRESSHH